MKIRIWQLIVFVAVIVAVTVALFPTKRRLIPYYERAGKWEEARSMLDDLLGKSPGDVKLLVASAEAYQTEGRPDLAIAMISAALKVRPADPWLLAKLAQYYELNRQPNEAIVNWEAVVRQEGNNRQAYARLIDLYRYRGDVPKEAAAIARLLTLEGAAGGKSPAHDLIMTRMITARITALASAAGSAGDPYLHAATISALYDQRLSYLQKMEEKKDIATLHRETVRGCLEALIAGDRKEEAQLFAAEADRTLAMGYRSRLTLARLLGEAGEGVAALALLTALERDHPEQVEVWRTAAETALAFNDAAAARTALERIVVLAPGDRDSRRKLAAAYVQTGEFARAYDLYLAEAGAGKGIAVVLDMLRQAGQSGNQVLAMRSAVFARSRFPGSPDVAMAVGELYLSLSRPDLAYSLYRQAVLAGRKDRPAVLKLLEVAGYTGRTEMIVEGAALARNARPGDPDILRRCGEIMTAQGRLREGVQAYLDYLRLRPGDQGIIRRTAEIYEWLEQPGKAYAMYQKLAASPGASPEILRRTARLAEAAGCEEDAFRRYLRLARAYPEDKSLQAEVARLALWTRRPKYAATLLAAQSDEQPRDYRKAMEAGRAFAEADQLDRGIRYFERAAALRPDDLELRRRLALYYGWLGNRDKQLAALEDLSRRAELSKEERQTLAEAYLEKRDGIRALPHLEHLAREDRLPEREGMMLVYAYILTKQEGAALKTLNRLARENSRNAPLLVRLGNEALALRQTDAALAFYEAALRLEPGNAGALKGSAQIYAWNNDSRRAARQFETHNRVNDRDIEARFQLGELYVVNSEEGRAYGEFRKTLRLIDEARKQKPNQMRRSRDGAGTGGRGIEEQKIR